MAKIKAKKEKTLKPKVVRRMFIVTPKTGVNTDFENMLILAKDRKAARKHTWDRTGILPKDLDIKKYKMVSPGVIAITYKEKPITAPNTNVIHP